jgi:hypothetical protein
VGNVVYAFPETPSADEWYNGLSPYSNLINAGGVLYGDGRPRRARRWLHKPYNRDSLLSTAEAGLALLRRAPQN